MLPTINRSKTFTENPKNLFLQKLPTSSSFNDERLDSSRSEIEEEQTKLSWKYHRDTDWGQCVEAVSSRPKGWIQRFADRLDESCIVEEKSPEQLREERLRESGWKNIRIDLSTIEVPNTNKRKEVYQKFPRSGQRMANCAYCFKPVSVGAELIGCERCDLVSHVHCIPDISRHTVSQKTQKFQPTVVEIDKRHSILRSSASSYVSLDIAARPNTAPSRTSFSSPVSPHHNKVPTPTHSGNKDQTMLFIQDDYTAKDIKWLCEFCQKDMVINKIYFEKKSREEEHKHQRFLSCIKLQSIARMFISKLRYRRFMRGIKIFQQIIRMRKFAKMAEIERINQRYVFKIRIHEIKVFALDPFHQSLLHSNPHDDNQSETSSSVHATHNHLIQLQQQNSGILPFPIHRYPYLVGKLSYTKFEKCLQQYLSKQGNLAGGNPNLEKENAGLLFNNNNTPFSGKKGHFTSPLTPSTTPMLIPATPATVSNDDSEYYPVNNNNNGNSPNVTNGIAEDERDKEILELLFQGHSLENPQYAKPYREMQILLKGTLFLTVTIHEQQLDEITQHHSIDVIANQNHQLFVNQATSNAQINLLEHDLNDPLLQGNVLQTYRYDLLLKHTGQSSKFRPNVLQKLGFSKNHQPQQSHAPILNPFMKNIQKDQEAAIAQHLHHLQQSYKQSTELDNATIEKLCRLYNLDTYNASKPFLLVPYTHANVTIKFTLSEVTEWPKASIIGQSSFKPQHFVIRKKILSVHQSFHLSMSSEDVPMSEEGGKLTLFLPKGQQYANVNMQQQFLRKQKEQKDEENAKKFLPQEKATTIKQIRSLLSSHSSRRKSEYLPSQVNIQAICPMITWSLISTTKNESQEYGYLMILNPESTTSIKKKYWCVLTDRYLLAYNIVRESAQLKFEIDLRATHLSLLPSDDLFRIRFNTLTLFCQGLSEKEQDTWFRKLYSLSLSHQSVSYQLYMRKKHLQMRGSFRVMAEEGIFSSHHHGGGGGGEGEDRLTMMNTAINRSNDLISALSGSRSTQDDFRSRSQSIGFSKSRSNDNNDFGQQSTPTIMIPPNGRRGSSISMMKPPQKQQQQGIAMIQISDKETFLTKQQSPPSSAPGDPTKRLSIMIPANNPAMRQSIQQRPKTSGSILQTNGGGGGRKKVSIVESRSSQISGGRNKASYSNIATPVGRLASIHNGMHASMHGRKSIGGTGGFKGLDMQAAAAAAVAAVNALGDGNNDYFGGPKPFHSRRRSAYSTGMDDFSKLTDEQKHDRMVNEVDEIIEELRETHSLENALKNMNRTSGGKLLDTLSSTIIHSRNLF